MCRLFGFRSNVPARVHRSLVLEKNSLRAQSLEHKDGWGIAFYTPAQAPAVVRGIGPAHLDPEYEKQSALVSSSAVIAHVRLASIGAVTLENTHPFVEGRWTFAHNGTLHGFADCRQALEAQIAPELRRRLRGETDSERCFYLFLTVLSARASLTQPSVDDVARALVETIELVCRMAEPFADKPCATNFLVTNGELMAATRRNRTLFFSDRPRAGSANDDPPNVGDRLTQIVIASEELSTEDHWHPISEEGVVAVEPDLTLRRWSFSELRAPAERCA